MKQLRWLFMATPLLMFGCSSPQDKTVTKATEDTVVKPTMQSDSSGGGSAGSEAKTEDRTKPEF